MLFVIVCFLEFFPKVQAHHRQKKLREVGIRGETKFPGYFRLRPYEQGEEEIFKRADRAHVRALKWILESKNPVLYLSGSSGVGKSSLLFAYVLPKLGRENPAYRCVAIRGSYEPTKAITDILCKLGTEWSIGISEFDSLTDLLTKFADFLYPRKLLIVLDQFEEFLITRDRDVASTFFKSMNSALEGKIKGLTILIAIRQDYIGLLPKTSLPNLRQQENWFTVDPFTDSAARRFFNESGLEVGSKWLNSILEESYLVEGTPRLVRPITLNMIGMIISRFKMTIDKDFEFGKLIRSYIRDFLETGYAQAYSPAILESMISSKGTRRLRSEAELASLLDVDIAVVYGCLHHLREGGLVRLIEPHKGIWEISHDFVARILYQILSRWNGRWYSRILVYLPYVSLAAWITIVPAFGIALVDYQASSYLQSKYHAVFPVQEVRFTSLNNGNLKDVTPYISRLWNVDRIDLTGTEVTDLSPLSKINDLHVLRMNFTEIVDIRPLAEIDELRSLELSGNIHLENIGAISRLNNLKCLIIADTKVRQISSLSNLNSLVALDLSGVSLDSIEPIENLSLRVLYMDFSEIKDLQPLEKLRESLRVLSLSGMKIEDVDVLGELENLEQLRLSDASFSDIRFITRLRNLRVLRLDRSSVRDLGPLHTVKQTLRIYLRGVDVPKHEIEYLKSSNKNLSICLVGSCPEQNRSILLPRNFVDCS